MTNLSKACIGQATASLTNVSEVKDLSIRPENSKGKQPKLHTHTGVSDTDFKCTGDNSILRTD